MLYPFAHHSLIGLMNDNSQHNPKNLPYSLKDYALIRYLFRTLSHKVCKL